MDKRRGLIGWPGSRWKTLIGGDATIAAEPFPHEVSFRLLDRDAAQLHVPSETRTPWKLAPGGVPVSLFDWQPAGLEVAITLFADSEQGVMLNLARAVVSNPCATTRRISFIVWLGPNSVAERKGEKTLRTLGYAAGSDRVLVNDRTGLVLARHADESRPCGAELQLLYHVDLAPGAHAIFDFLLPSVEQDSEIPAVSIDLDRRLERVTAYWQSLVPLRLTLPDPAFTDVFYASLHYILMLMGPDDDLRGGPSAYNRFFLHDSVEMAEALDKTGLTDLGRRSLRHFLYPGYDEKNAGYVDEAGCSIYARHSHFLLTRDSKWLRSEYPEIRRVAMLMRAMRARQLDESLRDTPVYGLMPRSVTQDNWRYPSHLYVDDWWALIAFQCAADAALVLGEAEDETWMRGEFRELESALRASFDRVLARDRSETLPAFADPWGPEMQVKDHWHRLLGHTQMAWAHRPALHPGAALGIAAPRALLARSYRHYWEKAGAFSGYDGGWYVEYETYFWGYNVMLAMPLIHLGLEEVALKTLRWSLANQSCPGAWMEAMRSRRRPDGLLEIDSEAVLVGDVPHGWCAGYYALLLRNMLIREEGDQLVLLSAVPEEWFADGQVIAVRGALTYHGPVALKVTSHRSPERNVVEVEIDAATPPDGGYLLTGPRQAAIERVEVDGMTCREIDGPFIALPPSARNVVITLG